MYRLADLLLDVVGDRFDMDVQAIAAGDGWRGVAEPRQVERVAVEAVTEQRHQVGPVRCGPAEAVHEDRRWGARRTGLAREQSLTADIDGRARPRGKWRLVRARQRPQPGAGERRRTARVHLVSLIRGR